MKFMDKVNIRKNFGGRIFSQEKFVYISEGTKKREMKNVATTD
ncbi:hypothetical protein GCM10007096_04730 [Pullulanibacillus pueri]|uniref:Uncharacterized protein n=1 Tax=Pullulanibacillus pueri TaxID=1437324 RepID=A0A8J2ZSX1_9BACL|nr:hypothetical protein GCM10007096_04730 [Pullulanibacillus pueri]